MSLIESLVAEGWLKTPRIIEAFRKIKREDFLPARIGYAEGIAGGPEEMKEMAELNDAFPIGYGQTISQPLTVAFMLEKLEPQEGDSILDVGSGSGWTTALLAEIAGKNEKVLAIEIVPELKEFGEKNIAKYGFIKEGRVKCVLGDGSKGYEKEAPFDRILAGASAGKIPAAWREQLKVGGRLVAPVGNSIWLLIKKSSNEFEEFKYPGFVFVPLIEKWKNIY